MMVTQKKGKNLRNRVSALSFYQPGRPEVVNRNAMYNHLVTNDLLREDEARELEDTLTRVARRDTVGLEDLQSAGLVRNLRNIGVTSYEYENLGEVSAANQHMAIKDIGDMDQSDYQLNSVPVPVTSSPFELDRRQQLAGQTRGEGIDTTNVSEHTRQVVEKLEDSLTNGGDVTVGGNSMPGYTTIGARDQVTLSTVWTTLQSNDNLDNAVEDVLTMRSNLRDNGFNGPYTLYLPSNYDSVIDDDYKAESDRTLRERLLAINQVNTVKVLPSLADDNVLLVQMTESVVQAAIAQDVTTVTWDLMGGLASRWVVMGVMAFAIKIARDTSDTNVAGISHLS